MGQIRDLAREWPRESAQRITTGKRITTGNTTLRQRVRHLTQENRVLEERLQAAPLQQPVRRRGIAQLEAQIAGDAMKPLPGFVSLYILIFKFPPLSCVEISV